MGTPGPQKVKRYSLEFKLKAVEMSNQPGILIQDVAESLCIHPFMLSRWRKQVREGILVGTVLPPESGAIAELQRLREVERQYKQLRQEHDRKPPTKSSVIWVRDKRRWCPLIFKWTPIYAHVISAALFITPHTPKLQRCLQSPSRS